MTASLSSIRSTASSAGSHARGVSGAPDRNVQVLAKAVSDLARAVEDLTRQVASLD